MKLSYRASRLSVRTSGPFVPPRRNSKRHTVPIVFAYKCTGPCPRSASASPYRYLSAGNSPCGSFPYRARPSVPRRKAACRPDGRKKVRSTESVPHRPRRSDDRLSEGSRREKTAYPATRTGRPNSKAQRAGTTAVAELRCDSPAEILTAAIRATRAGAIRNSHDASRHPCASVNVPPAAVTKAAPRKVRNTTRRAFRPARPASDDETQREDMRGFLPTISPEPAKRPATSHITAAIPVSLYKRISAADTIAPPNIGYDRAPTRPSRPKAEKGSAKSVTRYEK